MYEKLLLSVFLPPVRRAIEFRVPFDLTAGDAADLLAGLLERLESALYKASSDAGLVLIDRYALHPGAMLNSNETIRALVDQGVLVDGARVAVL